MYKIAVRIFLIILLFFMCFSAVPIYASTLQDIDGGKYGKKIIDSALPQETVDTLDRLDIRLDENGFNINGLWEEVKNTFKTAYIVPLKMLGVILVIAVITAGIKNFLVGQAGGWLGTVIVVCTATILVEPISDVVYQLIGVMNVYGNFVGVFLPLFAGILTVGGQAASASVYNIFLFAICQGYSYIINTIFIPLLLCVFCISVVGIIFPKDILSSSTKAIKSVMMWILGLSLTILIGLISVQTAIASVGDSVSVRTTKFLLGSLIPVAGSAIADLYTASSGFIHFAKGFTGVYGIIATMVMFMPSALSMAVWYIAAQLGGFIAGAVEVPELREISRAAATVFGFLLCILLYLSVIVIVATVMMLVIFRGNVL